MIRGHDLGNFDDVCIIGFEEGLDFRTFMYVLGWTALEWWA
jgi:hypothetical protein